MKDDAFGCLKTNVQRIAKRYPNWAQILTVHDDCTHYLFDQPINADMIYIDLPWDGDGPSYRSFHEKDLFVSGKPV